jgi:Zn-dependent protease
MDGSKVLKWNIPVYAVTFGATVVLAYLVLFGLP